MIGIVSTRPAQVRLSEVFSRVNVMLVQEYVSQIRRILSTKDAAMFVARKGICFFYALEANGFFEDIRDGRGKYPCEVFSTRMMSYAQGRLLGNIAVIDDVMVAGESMRQAMSNVEGLCQSVEYLVAGACTSLLKADAGLPVSVRPIRYMRRLEVLELAREITQYIQASGVSNNIDHPILNLRMRDGLVLEDALADFNTVNVATGTQRHYGISSYTVTLRPREVLSREFFNVVQDDLGLVIKCRFLARPHKRSFECIPIVLLPELSSTVLELLFNTLTSPTVKSLCRNKNQEEELRNKLRVVQFALSLQVGMEVTRHLNGTEYVRGGTVARLDRTQVESIFGVDIVGELRGQNYLNEPFDYKGVRSECLDPQTIRSEVGRIRTWALTDAANAGINGSDEISLSGLDILSFVSNRNCGKAEISVQHDNNVLLASLCLDSLIDRGVFVPYSRVKNARGLCSVVRSYHGGEIERMTDELIAQFALFLLYMQRVTNEDSFRHDVVDALGVLFARYATSKGEAQEPMPDDPIAYSFDSDMWGLRAGRASDRRGMSLTTILQLRAYVESEDSQRIHVSLDENKLLNMIVGGDAEMEERRNQRASAWRLASLLGERWKGRGAEHQYFNFLRKIIVGRSYRYAFGILRNDIDTLGSVLKDGFRFRTKEELLQALSSAGEKLRYRDEANSFAENLYSSIDYNSPDALTKESLANELEKLLDDPYCDRNDDGGLLSALYQEISSLIYALRAYISESVDGKSGGKEVLCSIGESERLTLSDKFEKCSASLTALFDGSDLMTVERSEVRNTLIDELQSYTQSKVLASRENGFSYCRRDILAIGLEGLQAGEAYPKCHFVVHDHTDSVGWGCELENSSEMAKAHTAVLFISPQACPSFIGENAQLVDLSIAQGKLIEGRVTAERLVRAINQFFVANVSSSARMLAVCQPAGYSFGFDEAKKEIEGRCEKARKSGFPVPKMREFVEGCVQRHIKVPLQTDDIVDKGFVNTMESCAIQGTLAQGRDESVRTLRKRLVQSWAKGVWSVGGRVESCVGSQCLALPGMEFSFYRIDG